MTIHAIPNPNESKKAIKLTLAQLLAVGFGEFLYKKYAISHKNPPKKNPKRNKSIAFVASCDEDTSDTTGCCTTIV